MSTLKVGAIRGVSASSDAVTVANDGTCTANITNNLSNRNLIINGAMQVAQRGTSSTSNGYHSVDRFKMETSNITHNSTKSRGDLSSSDTGPFEVGFRHYARIALSQAGVVAANSGVEIQQRIEAQNIAMSGWNYGSASSNITLQFWFRCSTNQTFYGYLYSFDGTAQVYTFSFTASGNNTWTKITKTIPGNSNLTFNNDNGPGLQLKLIPFYGTDFTNNKTLDQWAAYDSANQMPDMASTWLTAGASTFDLAGVQLEVGSTATDFEHRSFAQELALCQRYYFEVSGDADDYLTDAFAQATSNVFANFYSPVPMRANPTFTGNAKAVRFYSNDQSNDYDLNGMVIQHANTTVSRGGCTLIVIVKTGASSMTSGQGGLLRSQQDGATAQFSAEL